MGLQAGKLRYSRQANKACKESKESGKERKETDKEGKSDKGDKAEICSKAETSGKEICRQERWSKEIREKNGEKREEVKKEKKNPSSPFVTSALRSQMKKVNVGSKFQVTFSSFV